MKLLKLALILSLLWASATAPLAAQSILYVDEFGKIHVVNSPLDVPEEYRYQVALPTPPPVSQRFPEMKRKAVPPPERKLSTQQPQGK